MINKTAALLFLIISFIGNASVSCGNVATLQDDLKKVVAKDGTGNYLTIQDAVNDCKSFPYQRITIFIKNGIYREKVKIHEWNPSITLIGESRENTVITYDDYFGKINAGINSTFQTYTMLVEGEGFRAQNLTIQNTSGDVGQAVALSVHANRAAILNCNILGNQDTLYVTGNSFTMYFQDCLIAGTTDFIFGSATAFFKGCTIHSLKDSYVTAASTPEGTPFGFVFRDCRLTAEKEVSKVYLGRPWRLFAKTVFINCEMDSHIRQEGWHNWNKPEAEKNSFYAEYNCSGKGYLPSSRVGWSHQLTAAQAKKYTAENCVGTQFYKDIKLWQSASK